MGCIYLNLTCWVDYLIDISKAYLLIIENTVSIYNCQCGHQLFDYQYESFI